MIDWDYERSRCWLPTTVEEFADAHNDLHRVPSGERMKKLNSDSLANASKDADIAQLRTMNSELVWSHNGVLADRARWQTRAEQAEADLATRTRERDEARAELRRESERVDIVIAEFDAPWPHSHTVGDVVSGSLAWKIHQCRAAIENRAAQAESTLTALHAALVPLVAQWRAARSTKDSYGRGVEKAKNECADALEAALVVPSGNSETATCQFAQSGLCLKEYLVVPSVPPEK